MAVCDSPAPSTLYTTDTHGSHSHASESSPTNRALSYPPYDIKDIDISTEPGSNGPRGFIQEAALSSLSPRSLHPATYAGAPMHLYPFPPELAHSPPMLSKRRQVKNACTNCQKACKKCDDARPCLRCVKYGIGEECVDSQRKERKRGMKRGPYKKRDGKGNANQPDGLEVGNGVETMPGAASAAFGPQMAVSYMAAPVGYSPSYNGQYAASSAPKLGEAPVYYPQFYISPAHPPPFHANHAEGDHNAYPAHPFYTTTFVPPYPQHYPSYTMSQSNSEGQGSRLVHPDIYARSATTDQATGISEDKRVGKDDLSTSSILVQDVDLKVAMND